MFRLRNRLLILALSASLCAGLGVTLISAPAASAEGVTINTEDEPGGTLNTITEELTAEQAKLVKTEKETKQELAEIEDEPANYEIIEELKTLQSEVHHEIRLYADAMAHISQETASAINSEEGSEKERAELLGKAAEAELGNLKAGNELLTYVARLKAIQACKVEKCSKKKLERLKKEATHAKHKAHAITKTTSELEKQSGPPRNDPGIIVPSGAGSEKGIYSAINTVGFILIAFAAASFSLLSLWAALLWTTAGHNYTQVAKAKDQMKRNIIVFAVIASMGVFLHFVTTFFAHGL